MFDTLEQVDKEVSSVMKYLFRFEKDGEPGKKINDKTSSFTSKLNKLQGFENLTKWQKSLLLHSIDYLSFALGDIIRMRLLFIKKNKGVTIFRSIFRPITGIWNKFLNYSVENRINKLKKEIEQIISFRANLRDEINANRKQKIALKLQKQKEAVFKAIEDFDKFSIKAAEFVKEQDKLMAESKEQIGKLSGVIDNYKMQVLDASIIDSILDEDDLTKPLENGGFGITESSLNQFMRVEI